MLSCRIITDEYGNLKAEYANGFTFEGEFDENHTPVCGIIKDPEGKLVFEGELINDIYQYFQEYLRTGQTITSNGITL